MKADVFEKRGTIMITCKLCNTKLKKKDFRRDGSVLCPVCGQIYWKEAVEKALQRSAEEKKADENRK